MSAAPWPEDCLVLIPVFNHATTVGSVVTGAQDLGAPVLVVDDGSDDGSGEAAIAAGATGLRHARNQGKAAALLTGFQWAWQHGYTRVLTIDADGQHPVDQIPILLAASHQAPEALILGCRDMSVAPRLNRFGRWCSNASVWITCRRWPGDSQTGLRIYPLASILRLPLKGTDYAFEIEVLVRAAWAGVPLHPVPVRVLYPEDRISHFRRLHDNGRAIRLWLYLSLRACLPVGQRLRELPPIKREEETDTRPASDPER